MLTQERLKEILHYDETTGLFTWRVAAGRRVRVGSVAGAVRSDGYVVIGIDDALYRAHRLAMLYVYGEFPPRQTDHINGVTVDNRIANLRPATAAENQKNRGSCASNTSGYKGVRWHKRDQNWLAEAKHNGIRYYIGCFHTAEQASEAYQAFARQHHGAFYLPPEGVSV